MKTLTLAAVAALFLSPLMAGCASAPEPADPRAVFMARLNALCGQRFQGRVVTTDPADANFARQRLVMHVRDCSADEVRIPFAVGEDRSRTWVISRAGEDLRLKHDHRHEDGAPDVLHWYGGVAAPPYGTARQEFPVDGESITLFEANGAAASTTNVWALEVHPGRMFAYELRRPSGRFFRVEFDLTRPLAE